MGVIRLVATATACVVLLGNTESTQAADPALVSLRSEHSVEETIKRVERAIEARSDNDWRIVGKIDHTAQALDFGEKVLPRTTILFAHMWSWVRYTNEDPTLALDLPPRILIWQDEQGTVWLTYNSVRYWYRYVLGRHDITTPIGSAEGFTWFLETVAREATR